MTIQTKAIKYFTVVLHNIQYSKFIPLCSLRSKSYRIGGGGGGGEGREILTSPFQHSYLAAFVYLNFANCLCRSLQSLLFLPLCSTTQTLYSPSSQPTLSYSFTAGPFAIANSAKLCNYLYFILSLPHKYYTHPVPPSSFLPESHSPPSHPPYSW